MQSQVHILTFIKKIKKDPKFEVGDHVRISQHKNIFAKGYVPNWSEEVFVIKKVKMLMLFIQLILVVQLKELTITQKFLKLRKIT